MQFKIFLLFALFLATAFALDCDSPVIRALDSRCHSRVKRSSREEDSSYCKAIGSDYKKCIITDDGVDCDWNFEVGFCY